MPEFDPAIALRVESKMAVAGSPTRMLPGNPSTLHPLRLDTRGILVMGSVGDPA